MRLRLSLLLLLAAASPAAAQTPAAFHPPASAPESSLDAILTRVDHDDAALDNMLGGRDRSFRRSVDYSTMMTRRLLAAVAKTEKRLVKRNCRGRYVAGEICGLDYVPATCAQDRPDTYLYRTDATTSRAVRITTAWRNDPGKAVATYNLIGQGGVWKIDGIRCRSGDSFNAR